jgi:hypothetical protein
MVIPANASYYDVIRAYEAIKNKQMGQTHETKSTDSGGGSIGLNRVETCGGGSQIETPVQYSARYHP